MCDHIAHTHAAPDTMTCWPLARFPDFLLPVTCTPPHRLPNLNDGMPVFDVVEMLRNLVSRVHVGNQRIVRTPRVIFDIDAGTIPHVPHEPTQTVLVNKTLQITHMDLKLYWFCNGIDR